MDAVIENMRTSLEGSVRKMLTGQLGPKKASLALGAAEKPKLQQSKVFGISLTELCKTEDSHVPYLVKDICNFIKTYHLDLEGIFRISASAANTARLREAFERHLGQSLDNDDFSVSFSTDVDGHTAAHILKQFLRQLPEPLVPVEVLKLHRDTKCLSDESFATNVRNGMDTWPAAHKTTLQYLLAFLQLVMQNTENRMNVTGLAVVFAPNVFSISSGIEGLEEQAAANKAFERLLLTTDIVCDNPDDQGYLAMTSLTVHPVRPSRPAPPLPIQARPLPPPPVPAHNLSSDEDYTVEPQPTIPQRYGSLNQTVDHVGQLVEERESTNSSEGDEDMSDNINSAPVDPKLIDNTIRDVVKRHLFTAYSSSSSSCFEGAESLNPDDSDHDDHDMTLDTSLLPSVTAGRNKGPSRRKPTRQRRYSDDGWSSEAPSSAERVTDMPTSSSSEANTPTNPTANREELNSQPPTVSVTVVTTPDSGCLTAEEELIFLAQQSPVEEVSPPRQVFIPKLDLSGPMDDNDIVSGGAEVVPPLDLSEVAPPEDGIAVPKPLPRNSLMKPVRTKKKRKKDKNSPSTTKPNKQMNMSEPINVPQAKSVLLQENNFFSQGDSPEASPSRWRDAWSTDEESYTAVAPIETLSNSHLRSLVVEHDMDTAPSSPPQHDGFLQHHQLNHKHHSQHHKHHHHHHHHHHHNFNHETAIVRPKLQNSALAVSDDKKLEEIHETLSGIMISLDSNRKACARPEDITLMTREQIGAEKLAMQRELLRYEGRHGRPASKKEKEVMRHVYDRYRMVKRLMVDAMSPPFHATGNNRHYDDIEAVNDYELAITEAGEDFGSVTQLVTLAPVSGTGKVRQGFAKEVKDLSHVAGDLNLSELLRQQRETKSSRKRLRRKLKDFEKEFQKQNQRSVLPADRVVMATEYGEYRDMKAKLRLLEALIEKRHT